MAENYKHLYEQAKKMLTMYQDEPIPGFRKKIEELECKWIPVTERLPDLIPCNAGTAYSEDVIVWTDGRKAMMAVWDGKDFICTRYYWDAWEENITHWMPLPEPPKEGE